MRDISFQMAPASGLRSKEGCSPGWAFDKDENAYTWDLRRYNRLQNRLLSDNLYSLRRGTRARITCTGHVQCKSLHLSSGALGRTKTRQRSINRSTLSSMNSSICT